VCARISRISCRLLRIDGQVESVSADALTDEHTGQASYKAKVKVDRADPARAAPGVELTPSMPAEVFIATTERALLAYLLPAKPQARRCSSHPSGPFPSISASRSSFGCRPSRIASTMSGAKQVSGSSRQTKAAVTPSCSARSVID
jgi:hypothetical protein